MAETTNRIQPNNERKFRLECLKLAQACADPDCSIDPKWVIKTAGEFYRYVVSGETAGEVVTLVKNG